MNPADFRRWKAPLCPLQTARSRWRFLALRAKRRRRQARRKGTAERLREASVASGAEEQERRRTYVEAFYVVSRTWAFEAVGYYVSRGRRVLSRAGFPK